VVNFRVAGVIVAAGVGQRLGQRSGSVPKALRVLRGRTLLARSLVPLAAVADELVVAGPGDHLALVRREVADCPVPTQVVGGGATRQASVKCALEALSPTVDFVLVHDAARPLAPVEMVTRVVSALSDGAAAVVPTVRVVDSLRRVDADGGSTPLDRATVRAVQTPQGFRRQILLEAHQRATCDSATDDAGLVEATGVRVTLVDGADRAFKITTPHDWKVAEMLLGDEIDDQR
jgi:2-C-methyl-D-erythritol 4-phosphate cytidylyltransferase